MALIVPALAGSVAPFEEDADLEALAHHPLLKLDKLDMQSREFPLVFLSFPLAVGFGLVVAIVGHPNSFHIRLYI
jgi:hypothetical protein